MAKDPSSGQAAGPRQQKARRKGVTIDLQAEDVKGGAKNDPAADMAKKPARSASSEPSSSKVTKNRAAKGKAAGGKAQAGKARTAEKPVKTAASSLGRATAAATAREQLDRKAGDLKSEPGRPAQSPAPPTARQSQQPSGTSLSSAASKLIAALVGGVIALGGAVALDRLQILSIFGGDSGLSELQTQIAGVKEETGGQITDLQAQIAAFLAEQDARLTKAEQPDFLADLEARLAALETAVQSGTADPDAGLAAIEQKLAGMEEAIAAIKPEIDRQTAAADELAGRVKTLEGGLSGLADPQTVVALGARLEQLAGVIDNNASPQTIAALKSALAAESLAAAVAAGRPFAAELQILQSGPDGGADLTVIAPYAENGLPDAAALAAEFEALIPSLSPPEPERPSAPESAGLVDRLLAIARNVVEVRPAGPAIGGELMRQTGAILQALNGNNFKAAHTAWQDLPVEARQASAGWAAKLEARLAADALAGSLRAAALTRLATAGGEISQ